mmetsp:Transcript_29090/g.42225  ORF Transcript_29090/g.42225 Transcript_29090/m.42225 type:complete len:358 (+) Transcript_29090:88-1161(+)
MKRRNKISSYSMLFHRLEDAADHIIAMMKQEPVYRCRDYLSPRHFHRDRACEKEEKEKRYDMPSPPHMLLAVEECIRFIDSLVVGPKSPISISSSLSSSALSSVACDLSSNASSRGKNRCNSSSTASTSWSVEKTTRRQMRKWRKQMCTWSFMVVNKLNFDREIVSVAFSFLDRYLAMDTEPETITGGEFQLISMTALYTAIKSMQPNRPLAARSIVNMSHGYINDKDVLVMEMEMLTALEWRINPPTALAFVREFLPFLSVPVKQKHELMVKSRLLTELAVGDLLSIVHPQSSIAVASILVAVSNHCGVGVSDPLPPLVVNDFCKNLKRYANIDVKSIEIDDICDRLENMLLKCVK